MLSSADIDIIDGSGERQPDGHLYGLYIRSTVQKRVTEKTLSLCRVPGADDAQALQ